MKTHLALSKGHFQGFEGDCAEKDPESSLASQYTHLC